MRATTDKLKSLLLAGLLAGLPSWGSAPAWAQTSSTWAVDGGNSITPTVFSSLLVPTGAGTRLWLGGNFGVVGKVTGRAAWFDASGTVAANFPKLAASDVDAIAPYGSNAWLLGGRAALDASFQYPGLLVRVLADGSIDASFKVTLDGDVRAIATLPGGRIVIGGSFATVNGVARSGLAMLDATGKLLPWAPVLAASDTVPTALALVVQGSRVFVGGQFDSVNGHATGGLVAVGSQTGQLVWSPASTQIEVAWSLVVQGATLYAGITSNASAVEAIDLPTNQVTWSQASGSYPYALALGGGTLYASGGFTAADGTATPLAAFTASSGAPVPGFRPAPDLIATVQSLLYADHTLFVGGSFSAIGGKPRHNLAALSPTTGLAAAFDPAPGNAVLCLAANSRILAAGGFFGTANAVTRTLFAEIDPVTGAPTAFAPSFNGTPTQMASDGTRVYLTGGFDVIDGARRNYAAAFDIASHTLTSFAPDATTDTSAIEALAVGSTRVYIGGDFAIIAGKPFSNLAAFDKASGAIVGSFHPTPNAPVQGLLVDASQTLYVSGLFSGIAGASRSGGAALSSAGAVLPFNPDLGGLDGNPLVRLASDPVSHDLVLFGSFTSVAGRPAGNIAEVDPATGKPRAFAASTRGTIDTVSIDPASGTIYAGGAFLPASGITGNLAAFDQAGRTIAAPASTDGEVHTSQLLAASNPTLDIGGAFSSVDGVSQQGVAALAPR